MSLHFLRSAKKAELEENQRSYKQKKKRRRIKVQDDSSSDNNKVLHTSLFVLIAHGPSISHTCGQDSENVETHLLTLRGV